MVPAVLLRKNFLIFDKLSLGEILKMFLSLKDSKTK